MTLRVRFIPIEVGVGNIEMCSHGCWRYARYTMIVNGRSRGAYCDWCRVSLERASRASDTPEVRDGNV